MKTFSELIFLFAASNISAGVWGWVMVITLTPIALLREYSGKGKFASTGLWFSCALAMQALWSSLVYSVARVMLTNEPVLHPFWVWLAAWLAAGGTAMVLSPSDRTIAIIAKVKWKPLREALEYQTKGFPIVIAVTGIVWIGMLLSGTSIVFGSPSLIHF